MARFEMITEADLLDFVENRLPSDERALVGERLSRDPELAARCDRMRTQVLNVRSLRAVLPVEGIPQEWLELLEKGKGH